MIKNDVELEATKERIIRFWQMVEAIRKGETDSASYRASASGFLSEIDKMNREVNEYLSILPSEFEREKVAA
ncbi:MAG: hypothetical protein ABI954_04620 [Pyrinomonadaceae bacterium]